MRIVCLFAFLLATVAALPAQGQKFEYRLLATTKTSTMEREMNEAAAAGFVFAATMGGETAFGGNETVVVMMKDPTKESGRRYRLLATNKTSTMQKELNQVGAEGFRYCGQTVFNSTFGGREVAVILELDKAAPPLRYHYQLQATSKTSTMEKELNTVGKDGFGLVGLTVAQTAFGGNELVAILFKTEE
ncbi:MAG: hypothetical protein MUF01_07430 [Bryobacterales bacterium]|jgi:hypothetical protein|nr:hypothetical protein [Bryobacterales bacterium]